MRPYYADESVTLYHGDCLELADLWTCADVLVTDPPYGMAFFSGHVPGRPPRKIAGDTTTEVRDAVRSMWGDERPWLMFGTWRQPRPLGTTQVLVWDKTDGVGPGMSDQPRRVTHRAGGADDGAASGGLLPPRPAEVDLLV